jgi:ankyrin repeat protein
MKIESLFKVVRQQDLSELRTLIRAADSVDVIDWDTELPLLTYAVDKQWIEGVQVLINAGANPNLHATYEDHPLSSATKVNNFTLVDILLQAGADPNACPCLEIPLHIAVLKKTAKFSGDFSKQAHPLTAKMSVARQL